jgi:hypothetical protein
LKEDVLGAPLNPVPQVLRVFMEGFVDNDNVFKWGNVLHFHYTGTPPSAANCFALANDMRAAWGAHMAAECPSPTHLTSITVTDLTSDAAGSGEWTGDVPGTRGDDSIPANAALLISYPSLTRYKGGHPRTYLYVLGNADLEGAAHWSVAGTNEVQTHWQDFLTTILGFTEGGTSIDTFGFVRYRGMFLPNGGPPHFYLTNPIYTSIAPATATAKSEIASQRRRVGRRKA